MNLYKTFVFKNEFKKFLEIILSPKNKHFIVDSVTFWEEDRIKIELKKAKIKGYKQLYFSISMVLIQIVSLCSYAKGWIAFFNILLFILFAFVAFVIAKDNYENLFKTYPKNRYKGLVSPRDFIAGNLIEFYSERTSKKTIFNDEEPVFEKFTFMISDFDSKEGRGSVIHLESQNQMPTKLFVSVNNG